ncbi:MAG TPA: S8 family serine peptidase [Propionibacteriaceae bacterium]
MSKDRLGRHDRTLLAKALQRGEKRVTIMMATKVGDATTVANGIRKAGGTAAVVDNRLGYVRASVPTTTVDKVAALRSVVSVDLNEVIPLTPREATTSSSAAAAPATPPGPTTPDSNAFMPTRDTGSVLFRQAQPTWDGRGITIGILDSGVDLDHPALATTSTGERKIVDWVTATDPQDTSDPTWLKMDNTVQGPIFTSSGATWTAPDDRAFRISQLTESRLVGLLGGDLNRDGDTADTFGVLYDEASHDIWVDADQDRTFTAAERMRPYKEARQVGHFGTDNPATEVKETVPFVVEFREDVSGTTDYVNIGVVADSHGTHVAGIAAASKMFGGSMNGQAPGAKLVSARACLFTGGCTSQALIDGMIDLVANRGVNVVNMSIGGLPGLNDGNNARAELYNRLIDTYQVQIFISAGNSGPGVNTIGDPAVATQVVAVASSITKPTWQANYGSTVSSLVNLHTFSSRGPAEDGAFKPNVAAPGSAISTVPQWTKQADVVEAGYALPIGYAHNNGTSMAAPQATGSAALLLSAAKARTITVSARALRDALYTTAVPMPGVSTAGQGRGLVSTPLSWLVLAQAKAGAGGVRSAPVGFDYTVTAPVCTELSGFLRTPNSGPGVYNRCRPTAGGQVLNAAKTYAVSVLRTSGLNAPVKHNLRLIGDDTNTFSIPKTLTLGLNAATPLNVVATTKKQGLSAAILEVDDPATPVVDLRIPLTVIQAATPVNSAVSLSGSVQRNLSTSVFVTVPTGTKALQVDLSGLAAQSQTRFTVIDSYGLPRDPAGTLVCYASFSDPAGCNPATRTYVNPLPGIWEIQVEARRTSPLLDNPFAVTAGLQSVTVTPATQTLNQVTAAVPTPLTWTVTNSGAPVTVAPRGSALASTKTQRPTISNGADQQYVVVVPPGAASLRATIGNAADLAADLDLYVYRCAPSCVVVGQSAGGSSEESVTVANPTAATYIVLVSGYGVPSGSTAYDYLDLYVQPALGQLSVDTTPRSLASGASMTVTGQVVADVGPTTGRELQGTMDVVNSSGGVLGTGTVSIIDVQP